jgi:hypothetical protein
MKGKYSLASFCPDALGSFPPWTRGHSRCDLGVEEITEPALAQAEAIPGRGVVVADARAPRFERGIGVLFRDERELIAKRHAAQAEGGGGL